MCSNDDQLCIILSHEISHVLLSHVVSYILDCCSFTWCTLEVNRVAACGIDRWDSVLNRHRNFRDNLMSDSFYGIDD
jgi:hypothetical protein